MTREQWLREEIAKLERSLGQREYTKRLLSAECDQLAQRLLALNQELLAMPKEEK